MTAQDPADRGDDGSVQEGPDPAIMDALRRVIGAQRILSMDSLDRHGRTLVNRIEGDLPVRHLSRLENSRPLDLAGLGERDDEEVPLPEFRDHLLELVPAEEYYRKAKAAEHALQSQSRAPASIYDGPELEGSWTRHRRRGPNPAGAGNI